MDELSQKVTILEGKINKIQKYLIWVLISTVVLIVFLTLLVFLAPTHFWTYSNDIYVSVP